MGSEGLRQLQTSLDALFLRTFEAMHAAAIDARALRPPPGAEQLTLERSNERITAAYNELLSHIDSLEELGRTASEQNGEIEQLSGACRRVAGEAEEITAELVQLQSAMRPWLTDAFITLTASRHQHSS